MEYEFGKKSYGALEKSKNYHGSGICLLKALKEEPLLISLRKMTLLLFRMP